MIACGPSKRSTGLNCAILIVFVAGTLAAVPAGAGFWGGVLIAIFPTSRTLEVWILGLVLELSATVTAALGIGLVLGLIRIIAQTILTVTAAAHTRAIVNRIAASTLLQTSQHSFNIAGGKRSVFIPDGAHLYNVADRKGPFDLGSRMNRYRLPGNHPGLGTYSVNRPVKNNFTDIPNQPGVLDGAHHFQLNLLRDLLQHAAH